MESVFPRLWHDYLKPLRPVLGERERGRWDGDTFYRYSRPQNFERFPKENHESGHL